MLDVNNNAVLYSSPLTKQAKHEEKIFRRGYSSVSFEGYSEVKKNNFKLNKVKDCFWISFCTDSPVLI